MMVLLTFPKAMLCLQCSQRQHHFIAALFINPQTPTTCYRSGSKTTKMDKAEPPVGTSHRVLCCVYLLPIILTIGCPQQPLGLLLPTLSMLLQVWGPTLFTQVHQSGNLLVANKLSCMLTDPFRTSTPTKAPGHILITLTQQELITNYQALQQRAHTPNLLVPIWGRENLLTKAVQVGVGLAQGTNQRQKSPIQT